MSDRWRHPAIKAIAIGCSAGGLDVLHVILPLLPADFALPVVVVAHIGPSAENLIVGALRRDCLLPVVEAEERMTVTPGTIHVAPPDYHLLVEADHTFSLSVDSKVNNSRPSIDVFLASAADAWGSGLAAVLLTGANCDGVGGMAAVKAADGFCIVQDPATAYAPIMPQSAIDAGIADRVLTPEGIAALIVSFHSSSHKGAVA
ncbi:MAG: chemotaxis protein CheB [Phaeospirillum sp.]|nr:chemotaxis protein CheB [Phaeospirillum sp.]